MIDLSIIIVNYNVQYFIELALLSVERAMKPIQAEVIVIDNDSKDGSIQMIKDKFPWVTLITNQENVGFSKANNQGIEISKGKYVVLLNPDTVVAEDSFKKVVDFMDHNPKAGGLGVKMIDGSGSFLAESKRSLPTPEVAFYKMFGLASLFKKSRRFGKYHLSYLDENETNEVEILAGAYMVLRKSVLDEIGLLDETFFMYGEDIDLSYRILKTGYKNYYFADSVAIHYKGESTKKKDLNYIKIFYNAMIIFSNKHFTGRRDKIFSTIIKIAIYFRASIALINSYIGHVITPIIDFGILYMGMSIIVQYWENNHKYVEGGNYPSIFLNLVIPLYILLWVTSIFFSGGYDKPYRIIKSIRGIVLGTIILSIIYSFLNEDWRFSRAIILLGAFWAIFATSLYRICLQFIRTGSLRFDYKKNKRIGILGTEEEVGKTLKIFSDTNTQINFIGQIADQGNNTYPLLGNTHNLENIIAIFQLDEVLFCSKNYSYTKIIQQIEKLKTKVDYKIVADQSNSIIGSNNSSKSSGELYAIEMQLSISRPANKRNKRVLDIIVSLVFISLFPFLVFTNSRPLGLLHKMVLILIGKQSWVGIDREVGISSKIHIPHIKKGLLFPDSLMGNMSLSQQNKSHLNFLYLKNYSVWNDLKIITSNFPNFIEK